jgi:hypothetical protein
MMNQWISGVLGLAVAVVPFLTLSETTLTWTLVIVGLAITVSSFWGMIADPKDIRSHGTSQV